VNACFDSWPAGEVRALPLEEIGERYRRYRLSSPDAEEEMVRSLRRWGQLAPITVWVREDLAEVLDGFKRLSAARRTAEIKSLAAWRLEVDERGAKAAIYGLNQVGRHLAELEEACGRRLRSSASSAGGWPNWPKTWLPRWRIDAEPRSLGLGLRKGPAGVGASRGTVRSERTKRPKPTARRRPLPGLFRARVAAAVWTCREWR